ncbi:DKNYY domain-containing protein [Cocleimonas sp. KMM 6892]|uniref:DKNYY domain-containing protein n=1 Tax=unclassified Cocleimonas TaxID=2639732 RepID=UPI002DBA8300|nr:MULTISPECIES: DKNYY domain-containing protein [unclassified Cocleimonas]MEB8433373.1 DKNYY domain-containing protein [Cocleimonas sp. KMM 6892]MEC4716184.1 DKNYY domain-containing protein [Cocleimonas sp. KMM 6895]MEC4745923.1 DKNYY domain-containing protein [Cocleimonas sp. KMM 6896]
MNWKKLSDLPNNKFKCKEYGIIYWEIKNDKVFHQNRFIRGADTSSFEVRIEEDSGKVSTDHQQQFFGRDKNHIYHAWDKLKKIDRDSFEEIGNNYWKDKSLVYFEYETSLRPLKGGSLDTFSYLNSGYARDSSFAYYFGKPIKSCKEPMALTMTDSGNDIYARDNVNVYYDGAALKNSDPSTWEYISNGYSKDAKSIYYGSHKIPRVHLESWKPVSGVYSKDKNSVFYMWFKLKNTDPETWILLGNNFSRDSKSLFFSNNLLEGLEVSKFLTLPEREAKEQLILHQEILYKRTLSDHEVKSINDLSII